MSSSVTFVVQTYDAETDSIDQTYTVVINNVGELCDVLGIEKFEPWNSYELDRSDIEWIKENSGTEIVSDGRVLLRPRRDYDDYPYTLHTNRELRLMLDGLKPMSVFVDDAAPQQLPSTLFPEAKFDAFVLAGRFIKAERSETLSGNPERAVRRVFYTLPGETWRVKAYELMLETARKSGWNEGFERMEGSLLGYSVEENDIHVELQRKRTKTQK